MANVEFNSVKKSTYDGLGANVSDGALYFIKDNGEIRKGGKHVTGTRVYTATDSTGKTPVASLTIEFNGTEIANLEADDKPKKGDILMVEHIIIPASGNKEAVKEYATYVYEANGGTYSTNGWVGCVGNVDASKVILSETYTLAGNYTQVGNLNKGTSYNASGKSVADALRDIFTKELDNSTKTNPSVSLIGSNVSLEVGSIHPATEYTATWNDGQYGNKAYWGANDLRTETGAALGAWTISAYNGKNNSNATISGNTAKITTDAFTVTSTGDTTIASFSATNDLTNIKKAATNLGNEGAVVISTNNAGTQTIKVTGFRYWFYGCNVTPKDYTTVDGNGNATVATNDNIRALSKVTSLSTITVPAGTWQIVIAIPSSKTLTNVTSAAQLGGEVTGNYTGNMTLVKVGGADSTSTSIGSYAAEYKVYVNTLEAVSDADTLTITIA